MESYARRVRSGDSERMEGQAAAFYFSKLFGKDFQRGQEQWTNAALNYGYSILRGTIARGLVAHGLMPSIGLFHASEQNAFNLADDLIEPFRQVVDLYVAKHPSPNDTELRPEDKISLIGLLDVDVGMPRGAMSVLAAIEQSIESLARIYENNSEKAIELPTLIELRQHQREL